nr:zinc finger protein on ecdysone puffs isoform X2 [Aedes albopictus]
MYRFTHSHTQSHAIMRIVRSNVCLFRMSCGMLRNDRFHLRRSASTSFIVGCDNQQGGRRDYGGSSGGGDYHRRDSSGGRGGSSSRYHDGGSSSYDKRGNDHHSSSVGSSGGGGANRDRMDNRSSSRGRGDRSREPMGPPRSVVPRSNNNRGPPIRTSMGSRGSAPMSTLRRGSTRGRLTSRFRNDGRRGMITSRMGSRRDVRPPMPRRRFPPTRGGRDGIGRITKRTIIESSRVSRKALIKRALAAAKELDDDQTTENEGEDDDEEEVEVKEEAMEGDDEEVQDEAREDEEEEEDDGDKTVKDEEEEEEDAEEGDKAEEDAEDKEEGDDKGDETKEGEDGEGDEKKEAPSTPKKTVKKVAAKPKGTPGSEKSTDKDGEKKRDTRINTKYSKSYIKLNCVQCHTKCITFKEYQNHLFRGLHRTAMRRIANKTRDKLIEMRTAQRAAQKEEDEKVDENSEQKSSYCLLCQLNFRQPKSVHQKSDGHKEMKRFLMPYCATCKIGFKSPMAYEAHRASLEHLKFKARIERYAKEETGEDGAEIDLENFTTVDEVGNVDEPTDSSKDNASTPKKGDSVGRPGSDDEDDTDDETVIGGEHVKKVEVQYCDLCNMYLPRREDPEKMLAMHCKTRSHLKLYIREREDKKLRERAERIHKKKLSDAKAKKDAKKEKETSVSEADTSVKQEATEKKAGEEGEGKDATTDDQMWEVVDNDIGDLLREVGGPGEDGEEEEDDEKASSERYDKFKHTEKNGLDQSNIHDSTGEEEVASTDKKAGSKKATNGDSSVADKEVKAEA